MQLLRIRDTRWWKTSVMASLQSGNGRVENMAEPISMSAVCSERDTEDELQEYERRGGGVLSVIIPDVWHRNASGVGAVPASIKPTPGISGYFMQSNAICQSSRFTINTCLLLHFYFFIYLCGKIRRSNDLRWMSELVYLTWLLNSQGFMSDGLGARQWDEGWKGPRIE